MRLSALLLAPLLLTAVPLRSHALSGHGCRSRRTDRRAHASPVTVQRVDSVTHTPGAAVAVGAPPAPWEAGAALQYDAVSTYGRAQSVSCSRHDFTHAACIRSTSASVCPPFARKGLSVAVTG